MFHSSSLTSHTMAPINSSINSNVSLAGDTAVTLRKISFLPRCSMPRSLHRPTFALQKHMPPLSTSIRLLPQFLRPTTHILSAAPGTQVAVGEEVEPKSSSESSSPSKPKRSRPGRKSKMPPVKNEQLVPGATFKGIVLSIQPFGAFVDFGAFTDGLVHVSRLSDSFVKDVANVVTVGQEVSVRLIEANMETGRISLTMRDSDDPAKAQQQEKENDSSKFVQEKQSDSRKFVQEKQSDSRKFVQEKQSDSRKFVQKRESSKFMKGQDLEGTVKSLTRAGAFISLPEGEEGFLPTSEEAKEGPRNMMGGSSLEVGQEVSVRVLRVSRGQVTLTLKEEEDMEELDVCLTQGVVHTATNPFVIAFRGSQLISAFLDENKKADGLAKEAEVVIREGAKYEGKKEGVENKVEGEISGEAALVDEVAEDVLDSMVKDEERSKKMDEGAFSAAQESESEISGDIPLSDKTARKEGQPDVSLPHLSEDSEEFVEDVTEEVAESVLDKNENQCDEQEEPAALNSYGNGTVDNSEAEIISEDLETKSTAAISTAIVKQLREETGAGMMDCKKALMQNGGDIVKAQEYLRKKGLASADKKSSKVTAEGRIGSYIHDSRIGVLIEVNCETDFVARGDIFKNLVEDLAMQVAACSQVQHLNTEDVPKEIVNKEREIEMRKEDLLSKPEQIRSKIVDGRMRKRLEQLALLEQPFIKDDKVVVKDWVKQSISTIGENIKVKRFVRYSLGEGLERRSLDFAAEVAAQTASKSVSTSDKQEEPVAATAAEAGDKETVE